MIFYLSVALITTLLFYLANLSVKNKYLFAVLFLLFVLFPSLVGGLRDETVGRDLQTYGIEWFYKAVYSRSFPLYIESVSNPEYGYLLLNYVCGSIISNINFFFFITELLKMVLLGMTAIHFRKKIIAPLLVFSYMLYFYWLGLSMMRQSIALCICLYSMTYFFDAKYWQFLLLCLIAYLFHNSAFVFLGVGVMYWIKDIRFSFLINIAAILFLLTNSISILLYLSQTGLVKMELADLYINSGVDIPRTSLFLLFFCFGCLYVCKSKKEGEWDSVVKMLRLTLLYCLFFFIMSAFFEVAFRIAYYQMIVIMVLMPWIFRQSKKNNGRRICMSIYVLLFFYFYYVECQHGAVDTIPYKSIIVGI